MADELNKAMEKIEAYVNRLVKSYKADIENYIEFRKNAILKALEENVEGVKTLLKIPLPPPLNVLDILNKGGFVLSKIYNNVRDNAGVCLHVEGEDIFGYYSTPRIGKGLYRITVIVEKLESES